jgi:molybdenum cofactor synthesis domain-containing protein
MAKVISISKSAKAGRKYACDRLDFDEHGILGDHSKKPWISILDNSVTKDLQALTNGKDFESGEFGEHILCEGLNYTDLKVFDLIRISGTILEIMKVGDVKYENTSGAGKYINKDYLIQCRILKGGSVIKEAEMVHEPRVFSAHIITLSDRASQGIYADRSGPQIETMLQGFFDKINWRLEIERTVIPDSEIELKNLIVSDAGVKRDIIFTTGGTGVSSKDITVQVVQPLLDKEIPGIMEMIRMKFGSVKSNALLSCGVAGLIGNSLIYTLPGSVRAVTEYMEEITKTMQHLFYMVYDVDEH